MLRIALDFQMDSRKDFVFVEDRRIKRRFDRHIEEELNHVREMVYKHRLTMKNIVLFQRAVEDLRKNEEMMRWNVHRWIEPVRGRGSPLARGSRLDGLTKSFFKQRRRNQRKFNIG